MSGAFTKIGRVFISAFAVTVLLGGCKKEGDDVLIVSSLSGYPVPISLKFADIGGGLTGVSFAHAEWGDYDGDGDLDLAVMGTDGFTDFTKIYRNDAGIFVDISAGLVGLSMGELAWGDFDNDGDLDLFAAGNSAGPTPDARLYRNNGNGTFTEVLGGTFTGVSRASVAWGDYDNDGDLDLVVGGQGSGTAIYRNDAGASFTDIGAGLLGSAYGDVAWADFDNDGDLDLAVTGVAAGPVDHLTLYRNDGSGVFTDIAAGLPAFGLEPNVAWGDYDNDGDQDLAVLGNIVGTNKSTVYRNDGGGVFTDIDPGLTGVNEGNISWADFDNDGDLDISLLGSEGALATTRFYRNDGGGTFSFIGLGGQLLKRGNIAWGDYDGDGDLDMAMTGQDSFGSFVFAVIHRNDGEPSGAPVASNFNRAPAAPTGLSATVGASVSLQWSQASDLETPAAGLSYNIMVRSLLGVPDIKPGMSDLGTGYRQVVFSGPVQSTSGPLSWNLALPAAGTYFFSVQTVDSGMTGSVWAAEGSFTIP